MFRIRLLANMVFLLAILLLALGYVNSTNAFTRFIKQPSSDLSRKILGSTILIKIYQPHQNYYSLGLGTLFTINGEKYLLTHSHWSTLAPESRVLIYDWEYEYLQKITGQEFLDLIQYRDSGSMILLAPKNLYIRPLPLKYHAGLAEDEQVMIVLYNLEQPGRFELSTARILAADNGEVPGYAITTLMGIKVDQGHSGAGIWHDDQLIGNLWFVILKNPPVESWKYLKVSFIASFPAGFDKLWAGLHLLYSPEHKK